MAAQLRRTLPASRSSGATATTSPSPPASADLITYAQSWHWTDPARAVPEALRVLRPGGALALWWNIHALDVPWIADQDERLSVTSASGDSDPRHPGWGRLADLADPAGRRLRAATAALDPPVPVDTHLANLGSHSPSWCSARR